MVSSEKKVRVGLVVAALAEHSGVGEVEEQAEVHADEEVLS